MCAQRVVPRLDEAGVSLLAQLLAFDPGRRITARRALQHPYFAELRAAEAAAARAAGTLATNPTTNPTTSCSPGAAAALAPAAPAATPPNAEAPRGSCRGSCQSDAHGPGLEFGRCDGANCDGRCAGPTREASTARSYGDDPSGDVHMAGSSPDAAPAGCARVPDPKPGPAPRGRHAAPLSLLCAEPPEAAAGLARRGVYAGGPQTLSQTLTSGACIRAGSCGQLRCVVPRWPLATLSAPAAAQRSNSVAGGLSGLPGACHRLDYALQTGARECANVAVALCLLCRLPGACRRLDHAQICRVLLTEVLVHPS